MDTASATNAQDVKPIRILRVGEFTSAEGRKVPFTASDLQAIVASYDAEKDPAPLVIGHPKIDEPAYGWVGSLAVKGDELLAYPDRVEPSFAEAVGAGRYAKVSSQLYPPSHPGNPTPGQYHLKHVGFLGAHAPGVKGLGTVSFAADDAGELLNIEQETVMSDSDNKEVSFAEREQAVAAREQAATDREKALADKAKADLHAANISFAEGMIAKVTLAPAGKDLLVGVLDALGEGEPQAISFGEAGELTPHAAMLKLLDQAKPLVSLGEAAADDGKPIEGELDPAAIAEEAISFAEAEAKAGRPISAAVAVRRVTDKHKKGA